MNFAEISNSFALPTDLHCLCSAPLEPTVNSRLLYHKERGYASVREIEKLCKTDIRFMWLLQENKAPSFMTIDNFMNNCLLDNIDNIFAEINQYIFFKENVDINHVYIDGTKIVANTNKYSWVWKICSLLSKITKIL